MAVICNPFFARSAESTPAYAGSRLNYAFGGTELLAGEQGLCSRALY